MDIPKSINKPTYRKLQRRDTRRQIEIPVIFLVTQCPGQLSTFVVLRIEPAVFPVDDLSNYPDIVFIQLHHDIILSNITMGQGQPFNRICEKRAEERGVCSAAMMGGQIQRPCWRFYWFRVHLLLRYRTFPDSGHLSPHNPQLPKDDI